MKANELHKARLIKIQKGLNFFLIIYLTLLIERIMMQISSIVGHDNFPIFLSYNISSSSAISSWRILWAFLVQNKSKAADLTA